MCAQIKPKKVSEKISKRIEPNSIIHVHKKMKETPLKVFVKKDFVYFNDYKIKTILYILIKLDLVEEVPAVYYFNNYTVTRREVKGYRLKNVSIFKTERFKKRVNF